MNQAHHLTAIKKFLGLTFIVLFYYVFLIHKFGFASGAIVLFLTWSFFVLCTPVADAGFLLDFPLRLVFGVRMLYSEIVVWTAAILGNGLIFHFSEKSYEKIFLTKLFHKILITPNPYWSIILLSGIGTFVSISFGDNVYDLFASKGIANNRKNVAIKFIVFLAIFVITILLYCHLLESLGIKI